MDPIEFYTSVECVMPPPLMLRPAACVTSARAAELFVDAVIEYAAIELEEEFENESVDCSISVRVKNLTGADGVISFWVVATTTKWGGEGETTFAKFTYP